MCSRRSRSWRLRASAFRIGRTRRAKAVHPEIRGTLEQELEQVIKTFLSGSYKRRVQVVRLKDVDVIVVLNDPDGTFASSAGATLEIIREEAKCSALVRRTRLSVRVVKLFLHDYDFTVDLVHVTAEYLWRKTRRWPIDKAPHGETSRRRATPLWPYHRSGRRDETIRARAAPDVKRRGAASDKDTSLPQS
jgi:hypothetical protein